MSAEHDRSGPEPGHHRVAIIGAGFAGIGMAARLLAVGHRDVVILERAADLGGTWRDNSYPGCQCDVPSHLYSYSFAPNPDWSRSFADQHEIFAYLRSCAERFGVTPHIRYGAELLEARWDDVARRWHLDTAAGAYTADVLVVGSGPLSEPSIPDLPGIERFAGTTFHSACWDHDHDLRGERVAVVGTGASAIQFVPRIQPLVDHLTVFQRSAPWIVPRPDRPIGERTKARYRRYPLLQKAARTAIYWNRELLVFGLAKHPRLMRLPEKVARTHLEQQVTDPALRAALTPDYAIGCKRILLSDEYYPALTRPNVDLVTDAVAEVREHSIVTRSGSEHAVDTIIWGTGFAVTDHPMYRRLIGRSGRSMFDGWSSGTGVGAYKGTTVVDFPNLFLLAGPNTGLGHSSIVFMLESQFAYVLDALAHLDRRGAAALEVRPDAYRTFNDELHDELDGTVWNAGCGSWYLDERGRNPTLWPGFTWRFRLATRRFDADAYSFVPRTQPVWHDRGVARPSITSDAVPTTT
ncbi:MAG: NAD(P)/FAD-dependent oxidoreductase [Acidimicrobiia bacterium]|nr:NAD(P)/FAD-dependent oxidoreductase [Acidimicrobiia bacterium]